MGEKAGALPLRFLLKARGFHSKLSFASRPSKTELDLPVKLQPVTSCLGYGNRHMATGAAAQKSERAPRGREANPRRRLQPNSLHEATVRPSCRVSPPPPHTHLAKLKEKVTWVRGGCALP